MYGEPGGNRTRDRRLKRAFLALLHRAARCCMELKIVSIHAVILSYLCTGTLRQVTSDPAFVYHFCITVRRNHDPRQ